MVKIATIYDNVCAICGTSTEHVEALGTMYDAAVIDLNFDGAVGSPVYLPPQLVGLIIAGVYLLPCTVGISESRVVQAFARVIVPDGTEVTGGLSWAHRAEEPYERDHARRAEKPDKRSD
jgi:hypothetical protein